MGINVKTKDRPFIGFGIVGTGMAAEMHARAITQCAGRGARLIGFASRSSDAALARIFDRPCIKLQDMLARSDVDVVCICSPSGLHAQQALEVVRAGKHALVEKPLAISAGPARNAVEAFEQSGRLLAVAFQRRVEPMFQSVQQAICSGELGDLICGTVSIAYRRDMAYFNSAAWRGTWAMDGGGVLINQGIHLLDLLIWFMGDPVLVQARAATLRHDIEVEDTLCANLAFAGGALATVLATTATEPGYPHRLEIYGTKGAIQIEGEKALRWQTPEGDKSPELHGATVAAGAGGDPRAIPISGHIGLIDNFMAALRGEQDLVVDGRQGLRSVVLVEKIYAAAGLPPIG